MLVFSGRSSIAYRRHVERLDETVPSLCEALQLAIVGKQEVFPKPRVTFKFKSSIEHDGYFIIASEAAITASVFIGLGPGFSDYTGIVRNRLRLDAFGRDERDFHVVEINH